MFSWRETGQLSCLISPRGKVSKWKIKYVEIESWLNPPREEEEEVEARKHATQENEQE